jgi:hypothetical protein
MTATGRSLRATRTTCPYCGVGCGVLATPDGNGGAGIAGDPEHPANLGRLCSKGSALSETLGLENRLLYPMIRCKGVLERVAWSDALDHVAHRLNHIIARDGAGAVAFYLSGQMLTEDYYVANKLMKGFIGSANVDTNSRLCMASSVAGHRRAFGADTVPGCYEDLDEADLLVLVGSNAAWCHPVLFQRTQARPTCFWACGLAPIPRCSVGYWCILPTAARSIPAISNFTPRVSTRRWRGHGASPAGSVQPRSRPVFRRPMLRVSSRCSATPSAWSRCIRKASTSRRKAPTRSTPFSIATSPRGGSVRPARRRSR